MGLLLQRLLKHFHLILLGCMIWREMFGNGAVTCTGPTIIKRQLQTIRKARRTAMILKNQAWKNTFNGEDHFYAAINIASVTKRVAAAKVKQAAPVII